MWKQFAKNLRQIFKGCPFRRACMRMQPSLHINIMKSLIKASACSNSMTRLEPVLDNIWAPSGHSSSIMTPQLSSWKLFLERMEGVISFGEGFKEHGTPVLSRDVLDDWTFLNSEGYHRRGPPHLLSLVFIAKWDSSGRRTDVLDGGRRCWM